MSEMVYLRYQVVPRRKGNSAKLLPELRELRQMLRGIHADGRRKPEEKSQKEIIENFYKSKKRACESTGSFFVFGKYFMKQPFLEFRF